MPLPVKIIAPVVEVVNTWASYAPVVNLILLVFVLGGLISLHFRMRRRP